VGRHSKMMKVMMLQLQNFNYRKNPIPKGY